MSPYFYTQLHSPDHNLVIKTTNSRTGRKFTWNKVYSITCKGFFDWDALNIKNVGLKFSFITEAQF